MANLTVTILIRTTQNGKRAWIPATGKNDPAGAFYLRWCQGSRPRFTKVGDTYEDAELAQLRKERELKAASQGFIVPEQSKSNPMAHRITDVIEKYMTDQGAPDQNGEYKSKKSLNSTRFELETFTEFSRKTYVEEITRNVLIDYRDYLNAEEYERDTVYNKLMTVVTWLKHNKIVPYKPLLEAKDWPTKKRTTPDPYTEAEVNAMIAVAIDPNEALLVEFMAATGMREGEVSVAEREDLDEENAGIHVRRAKPEYDWRAKNDAAERIIYIGDELIAKVREHGPGLLFPKNGRRNTHLLRVIERLATLAKVTPTTAKKTTHRNAVKNDWCHRFRDTWLTDQVENARDVNDLRLICQQAGHSNLETLDVYAQGRKANDPRTRAAANRSNRYGVTRPGIKVVGIKRNV